ncbi:MAG: hypothetical protein IT577_09985 [Verrucomicrobiae bacterium]|nr:hypothetical protein [Verrucomicrobiae bacterium]
MANTRLSLAELKRACADPRWRSELTAGRRPPVRAGIVSAAGRPVGALFRDGVMALVDRLLDPEAPRGRPLAQWPALWSEMHQLWAGQILEEMTGAGRVADAARLAEACRRWCAEAVGWRVGQGPRLDWRKVLPRHEFTLDAVPLPAGDTRVLVDGPLAGVRRPAGRALELCDWRGEKAGDPKDDLLDLAIEHRLLKIARPLEAPVLALEYFLPERELVVVSGDDLEAIAIERLDPILRELVAVPAPEVAPGPEVG